MFRKKQCIFDSSINTDPRVSRYQLLQAFSLHIIIIILKKFLRVSSDIFLYNHLSESRKYLCVCSKKEGTLITHQTRQNIMNYIECIPPPSFVKKERIGVS